MVKFNVIAYNIYDEYKLDSSHVSGTDIALAVVEIDDSSFDVNKLADLKFPEIRFFSHEIIQKQNYISLAGYPRQVIKKKE